MANRGKAVLGRMDVKLTVQHPCLVEQGNVRAVVGQDRIWHEDEFFVENLRAVVVAHPVLVIEVKQR